MHKWGLKISYCFQKIVGSFEKVSGSQKFVQYFSSALESGSFSIELVFVNHVTPNREQIDFHIWNKHLFNVNIFCLCWLLDIWSFRKTSFSGQNSREPNFHSKVTCLPHHFYSAAIAKKIGQSSWVFFEQVFYLCSAALTTEIFQQQ